MLKHLFPRNEGLKGLKKARSPESVSHEKHIYTTNLRNKGFRLKDGSMPIPPNQVLPLLLFVPPFCH